MRLTFDPTCNIAYIELRPKRGKVRTVQVSDELNVTSPPTAAFTASSCSTPRSNWLRPKRSWLRTGPRKRGGR